MRKFALLMTLALAACDIGFGGGGPAGASASPLPPRPPVQRQLVSADPVERGAKIYKRQGCRLCHGEKGVGGFDNPNSQTGGKVPSLILVKEGYSRQELIAHLVKGVATVPPKDPAQPVPPYRMQPYGQWLNAAQLGDLADYLISLYPKDRVVEDDWDDEGDDDDDVPVAPVSDGGHP